MSFCRDTALMATGTRDFLSRQHLYKILCCCALPLKENTAKTHRAMPQVDGRKATSSDLLTDDIVSDPLSMFSMSMRGPLCPVVLTSACRVYISHRCHWVVLVYPLGECAMTEPRMRTRAL